MKRPLLAATHRQLFFFFPFPPLSSSRSRTHCCPPVSHSQKTQTHNPVTTHQTPAHTHTQSLLAWRCDTISDKCFFLLHFDTSDGKLIAQWARNTQPHHPPPPHTQPPSYLLSTLLHLNCIFVHLIRLRMDRQLRRRAKQEIWQLLKGSVLINYHLRNKLRRLRRFQSLHGNKGAWRRRCDVCDETETR